jgi:Protein of unknown function (DUF1549)/Protein of unknown function (DUF1553)
MKSLAAFAWPAVLLIILAAGIPSLAEEEKPVATTAEPPAASPAKPLHELIDQRLAKIAGFEPVRCSDSDFLRRVSLDLTGMPPTADEARAFLADTAADKRQRIVDRLFASPHFARHLATTLDLWLMERRANTHVSADEWRAWLLKCVRENKPWNVLIREILQADGEDPAQRPAARFALDRASEPNLLTRDVGRIVFGRDMQCAQCHDHPIVDDYLQSDYHGLLAFWAPSYPLVRTVGDKQITVQAERAGTDLTFESVFVKVPRRTSARVPEGTLIEEPFLLPGDEYHVAPADNVKSVPKFSRRVKLAELVTDGSNAAFNRNIVNRLWAHMFGRGLVHPSDLHHPNNPPADPELLQLLAERFVAMNFDTRGFLREIALSGAYQRPFDLPSDLLCLSKQATAALAQLQEQRQALEQSAETSSNAYAAAAQTWEEAEATMMPPAAELDAARNQYAEAKKKVDEAAKAAADATAQLEAKKKVASPVQQAASAAAQAAKALPDDTQLADAAQKFAARAEQLAAEAAALSKAVEEKSAAIQAPTDALNNLKPTVDAALTKATPLISTVKVTEKTMRTARSQAANDTEALQALERRLATAERLAKLPELNQAVIAANQAAAALEPQVVAARKELDDFTPVIAQQEAAAKAATDAQKAAADAVSSAQAEFTKQAEAAQAIVAALASAEMARQKLPEDPVLTEVVAKLSERASAAQTQTLELQQRATSCAAAHQAADAAFVAGQELLASALAERARREKAYAAANDALAAAASQAAMKQGEYDKAVADLADRWTNQFTVASLKPLTPEQLCWTVFRVTGVYDRYWQTEVAELDKTKPLTHDQKQDAAQVSAREVELEQRTFDKLKDNIATFVSLYGAAAGQPQGDFFSTADQALFAANGGSINSWVAPAADNVTDRIVKHDDPRAAAEELYLAVLTRQPSEEEAAQVAAYLTSRSAEKAAAAQELVWGLLNSAEFRFNH